MEGKRRGWGTARAGHSGDLDPPVAASPWGSRAEELIVRDNERCRCAERGPGPGVRVVPPSRSLPGGVVSHLEREVGMGDPFAAGSEDSMYV